MSKIAPEQERITSLFRTTIMHLVKFCESYNQDITQALNIVVKLRTLFHDTKYSKSLFGQFLSYKNKDKKSTLFCESAKPSDPNDLFYCFPLVSISIVDQPIVKAVDNRLIWTGSKLTHNWYFPRNRKNYVLTPFDTWWNSNLVITAKDKKYQFTRKKLIVDRLANQDGGAHVDSNISDHGYNDLISGNFTGDTALSLEPLTPELIVYNTVRQIAEEVLETFEILGYIGKIPLQISDKN